MSNYRHGYGNASSPTYRTWAAMKRRCDNPNVSNYRYYGGRGIAYDPAWAYFKNFLHDMGERPLDASLDRIDPNGNYCKDNCRWATLREQQLNTRTLKLDERKLKLLRALYRAKKPTVASREWARLVAPLFNIAPETARAVAGGYSRGTSV